MNYTITMNIPFFEHPLYSLKYLFSYIKIINSIESLKKEYEGSESEEIAGEIKKTFEKWRNLIRDYSPKIAPKKKIGTLMRINCLEKEILS